MMPMLTSYSETLAAGNTGASLGKAAPRQGTVSLLPGHGAPVQPRHAGTQGATSFAALLPGHVAPVLPRRGEAAADGNAMLLPNHVAPVLRRQGEAEAVKDGAALLPGHLAPVLPRQGEGDNGNILPAMTGNEDEAGDRSASDIWAAPPAWLITCPAPARVAGEELLWPTPTDMPAANAPLVGAPAPEAEPAVALTAMVATGAAPQAGAAGEAAPAAPALSFRASDSGSLPAPGAAGTMAGTAAPPLPPALPPFLPPVPADGVAAVVPPRAAAAGVPAQPMILTATGAASTGRERSTSGRPGGGEAVPAALAVADHLLPVAGRAPQVDHAVQTGQVAPAAQMFAAAIHRAAREGRRGGQTPDALIAGLTPATAPAPPTVATMEHGQPAALDMARATWPVRMIERIEMIRDAADAADTSIRLVPDKLGAIDVSLRREGDGVAVQFSAQQAETRQLLADAQPRLAELAEAKGLKLSTGAGLDPGQQQQSQQQRAPAATLPATSRPDRAASSDAAGAAEDRIA